ncbi:hypothetical protein [Flavihumibacter fluvii]|uniref:hypothetical protein n=1 Tax=Flavihumibacter fluvii TaxID=2838157 RepID=UPI001BDE0FCA|nr:hypothetical protein [Flavihumibacter fluvii]ULQ53119.1 hypothetical protein KJS93_02155 [Flavihumibacter fluvii]
MSRLLNLLGGFLFISCLALCCTKEEGKILTGRDLLGVWVDFDHPADTLIIYRNGDNLELFDNSMAFRAHPDVKKAKASFTSVIRLKNNGIDIATNKSRNKQPEYREFNFRWLQKGTRFRIAADSFRPYLNSEGGELTYRRVE